MGDEYMFIPENILITVGHSILRDGSCTSAGGYVQEYAYCKKLAPVVQKYLLLGGAKRADVCICPERQFTRWQQERDYKLPIANSGKYDAIIELHLNAFNGTAKGTECLYLSAKGKELAQRVNDQLDDNFTDRGVKYNNRLYILNSTKPVAMLIEAFFCDSAIDYAKADEPHEIDRIARQIAQGILNKKITEQPTTPSKPGVYPNGDYDRLAKVVNTGDGFLAVRSGRGTGYRELGRVNEGSVIEVNYCKDNWFSTYCLGGLGFVHGSCLQMLGQVYFNIANSY